MSLELTYRVGQPHIIPLSAHLQKKLVWSGHNVLLSTLQQELHHESFDPVKSELDNAYHVTCSIAAEYHCMEEAAANMAAMSDICCDSQTAVYVPALAKLNASAAIDWLQQNYEEQNSVSLPRGALYSHYLDFCQEANIEPMNQASLGKVIRSIFPDVKTRRLGTRGQSK
ncbi:hypothetical protein NP493_1637g00007 [Ridgeia piscesae]|uniref:RFX-type winged-helix domain-containing protein n=1 Tax=Ridgeia piscesae TaxID=27915 RepID=A0AAD9NB04_RIDPI|nr:hypothetical protein NP493_1637g00007 [Ridgeia piscesae]